jgi:outer membrane protein TolC
MQRNFDMTLINLNKTIGEPVDKKYISYSSDNMSIMTAIKPYDEYLSDAMKNRAEILNAELGYKLKKIEYDLTKAAYPLESDIHNSDAKFAMDDAYNTLEAAKIDLEIEIASAYKELEKRLKNWESSEKLYQSAQENYKGVVSKYSMNMVTEKVLTDANISLAKAEMQLKNARRDLWIQQLKMEYASGIGPGIKNFAY